MKISAITPEEKIPSKAQMHIQELEEVKRRHQSTASKMDKMEAAQYEEGAT